MADIERVPGYRGGMFGFNRRKDEELRQVSRERLRRLQLATAEYMRIRVEQGLDETFGAWEDEPPTGSAADERA